MKKKKKNNQRRRLEKFILAVLEQSSMFCMDNREEREALADALSVDITGCFKVSPKEKSRRKSVFAELG